MQGEEIRGLERCNKKQRDDAYEWQRSRDQRKGRNIMTMTKEFAKMLALSLASVLLLAAAAVTSGSGF